MAYWNARYRFSIEVGGAPRILSLVRLSNRNANSKNSCEWEAIHGIQVPVAFANGIFPPLMTFPSYRGPA